MIVPGKDEADARGRQAGRKVSRFAQDIAAVRTGTARFTRQARAAVLYRLPERWRVRIVARTPDRFLPPDMRARFWSRLYDGDADDPFGFDTNPDERLKFDRTLTLCGPGELGRVLEVGCSVGTFTEALAPRCAALLAVDISDRAVMRTARRVAAFEHVRCEICDLTQRVPAGPFDLIIVSDVLYYWTPDEIVRVLQQVEATLAPGGALLALHYVPPMGTLLTGNEVHDLLARTTTLDHELGDVAEFGAGRPYRLDRYRQPE